jgi:formylglycine-generating enzyme
VVCVNFADVNAYIDWLSRKTGSRYRLPSDAEYEYAQRAGTTTPYWWGEDKDRTQACQHSNQPDLDYGKVWDPKPLDAHYRFQCHDGYAWTSPVGSFKPNPWGLYDMQGNIWHWVEDCWHDTYEGAPTDGSAWTSGDCDLRSSRGGSFGNAAWSARAGNRAPILNEYAGHSWGFRVVKEQ